MKIGFSGIFDLAELVLVFNCDMGGLVDSVDGLVLIESWLWHFACNTVDDVDDLGEVLSLVSDMGSFRAGSQAGYQ